MSSSSSSSSSSLLKKYKKLKYLGKGSYGAALLVELRSNAVKYVMKEIVIGHLSSEAQKSAVIIILSFLFMIHSPLLFSFLSSFLSSWNCTFLCLFSPMMLSVLLPHFSDDIVSFFYTLLLFFF